MSLSLLSLSRSSAVACMHLPSRGHYQVFSVKIILIQIWKSKAICFVYYRGTIDAFSLIFYMIKYEFLLARQITLRSDSLLHRYHYDNHIGNPFARYSPVSVWDMIGDHLIDIVVIYPLTYNKILPCISPFTSSFSCPICLGLRR
jgi:hypothetical protein